MKLGECINILYNNGYIIDGEKSKVKICFDSNKEPFITNFDFLNGAVYLEKNDYNNFVEKFKVDLYSIPVTKMNIKLIGDTSNKLQQIKIYHIKDDEYEIFPNISFINDFRYYGAKEYSLTKYYLKGSYCFYKGILYKSLDIVLPKNYGIIKTYHKGSFYKKGRHCLYKNHLYVCIKDVNEPMKFNKEYWKKLDGFNYNKWEQVNPRNIEFILDVIDLPIVYTSSWLYTEDIIEPSIYACFMMYGNTIVRNDRLIQVNKYIKDNYILDNNSERDNFDYLEKNKITIGQIFLDELSRIFEKKLGTLTLVKCDGVASGYDYYVIKIRDKN